MPAHLIFQLRLFFLDQLFFTLHFVLLVPAPPEMDKLKMDYVVASNDTSKVKFHFEMGIANSLTDLAQIEYLKANYPAALNFANRSLLQSGVYFCKVSTEKYSKTKELIIQK